MISQAGKLISDHVGHTAEYGKDQDQNQGHTARPGQTPPDKPLDERSQDEGEKDRECQRFEDLGGHVHAEDDGEGNDKRVEDARPVGIEVHDSRDSEGDRRARSLTSSLGQSPFRPSLLVSQGECRSPCHLPGSHPLVKWPVGFALG